MDYWKIILTLCQTSIRSSAFVNQLLKLFIYKWFSNIYILSWLSETIEGPFLKDNFLFQADYIEFRFIILSIGRVAMQVHALKKLVFSTLFWFNSIYWSIMKDSIEMLCSFFSWRNTTLYRSILHYSTFSAKTFASAC